MKKKVWDITVKDNPNRVVMGENDEFYTTDTEAYLVFNLQDKDFSPPSAVLTLENRNNGSLKNEKVEVVDGVIEWEMPQRYIEHFGNWQGQLVYYDPKEDVPEDAPEEDKFETYTSAPFSFVVNAHIGDKKKPSLVEIENWEKFIRDGTELIETWEDLEALREENERQRQANYQELLDTGVLQTNINSKLEALEEEYAPKLTEVTAQLAQTATKKELDLKRDKSTPIGVNDADSELLTAIQGGTTVEVLSIPRDYSVTPKKATFFDFGKNLFNPNDPDAVEGGYYTSTGVFTSNSGLGQTGYIPVEAASNYTDSSATKYNMLWFDENKTYLSLTTSTIFTSNGYVTAPSNAKYARFTYLLGGKSTYQVENNTVNTTYELYREPQLDKINLPPINLSDINNVSVSAEQTDFFEDSKNLFNINDVDNVYGGYYLNNGNYTEYPTRGQTGFVKVQAGENYTHNTNKYFVYWYNEYKGYIGVTGADDFLADGYVTAPANAKYAKFIFEMVHKEQLQIEKGITPTAFVPFGATIINDYMPRNMPLKNYQDKKVLFMGDSITSIGVNERGWVKYFNEIIQPASFINVAVSGATWCDKEGTVYDGNPVNDGSDNNVNNVIGNQVEKVIQEGYEEPDMIIIAAGTNDSSILSYRLSGEQIEEEFFVDGSNVPLESADRTNFAGAIRYTVETLRELYPNAQIFITTPLQRANTTQNLYSIIKEKNDMIKKLGLRVSVPIIDAMESGIYGQNAIVGTETIDHFDGLHLSIVGAKKFGEYNARKIINWFCF